MRLKGSLIPQYRQMHRTKRYSRGSCVRSYVAEIAEIVAEIPTTSILDYGSGKGKQYTEDRIHEAWGVMPVMFDPGVPGLDKLPAGTFDGVICTGVLEHIPENEMDVAISNLAAYSDKWAFVIVGLEPTKKRLPDGRQAHVTLRPYRWWIEQFRPWFDHKPVKLWLGHAP